MTFVKTYFAYMKIFFAIYLFLLRACLYGVELSLVEELSSPQRYLLPSVYRRKFSLLTKPKLGPVGSKDWRELFWNSFFGGLF